jgi:hypothetical protein
MGLMGAVTDVAPLLLAGEGVPFRILESTLLLGQGGLADTPLCVTNQIKSYSWACRLACRRTTTPGAGASQSTAWATSWW